MRAVLNGNVVDITASVQAVELLVDELEMRGGAAAAAEEAAIAETEKERLQEVARDVAAKNMLAALLQRRNEPMLTRDLLAAARCGARKGEEILRRMHGRCERCEDRTGACADHVGLLEHPKGKKRGRHRMTPKGVEVAEQQHAEQRKGGSKV
jgi:hypothetical protein